MKLISTTTADPIIPKKNIASSSRIATTARIMLSILPHPDVLHSPLYAIFLETVGRCSPFRRPARVAVPARRAAAALGARSLPGLAWFRSSGLFSPFNAPAGPILFAAPFSSPTSAASCGTWATATGFATRCALRRHAAARAYAAARRLQPGAGALLRSLRPRPRCWCRRATGSTRLALAFAPFLWTGLDLAAARITSVPWDQLGYSQVDNALVNQLAPWTGVYGITFVLVAANALLAGGLLLGREGKNPLAGRWAWAACGAILAISGFAGVFVPPSMPDPTATAVLIQPNLDVGDTNIWRGPGVGPPYRRIYAFGRRRMQILHRRNPANRRAHG